MSVGPSELSVPESSLPVSSINHSPHLSGEGGESRFSDLRGVQWRINLGILPPFSSIDELRRVTADSRRSVIQKAGTSPEVLRRVLDAVDTKHPEVLKPPLLKSLYYVLVHLSLDLSPQCFNFRGSNYFDMGNQQFGFNVTFKDICTLADFLFEVLSRRFEQLFTGLGLVPVNIAFERASLHSDSWGPPQELAMLLRCCMVMLHLLEFDQSLLSEKCRILLSLLSKLCSPDLMLHVSSHMRANGKNAISFKRSVSCESKYASDGGITSIMEECDAFMCFVEQSGSPIPFLCSIIEVFVDELLVHRQLRQYFMTIDTVSCSNEKLFMCHFSHGDSDAVLEMISIHFLLSGSDEQAFKKFLNTLFWQYGKEPPFLELSLTAAMQLLGTPVVLSAPEIFQAYMISLVSRCIGIHMASEDQRLDPRVMNCYLSAFEKSFIFYARHMSSLQLGDHAIGAKSGSASPNKPCTLGRGFHPIFESYVQAVTYNKINLQITKFSDSWHPCFHDLFSKTEPDLMSASIAYVKENQHILDKSHRDEILSILNCILSRTLSSGIGDIVLNKSGDVSQQEMYLLGSIIKLMSSSLLQTIWSMRSGSLGCPKTLKDYSLCREYDFIIGIIGCFPQYSISHPIQKLLCDVMGTYPARHKESKLMLMHFAGLLFLSFDRGLEFLWKGCIFMMMTLMNLFIFEEGNLDALKPLLGFQEKSLSSQSSKKFSEVSFDRHSSLIIASKFQKTQMVNLRMDTLLSNGAEMQDGQSETSGKTLVIKDVKECVLNIEEDDTCNGESFIKCRQKGLQKPSDFDDLADFIVCKRGKDYSSWLKDRERYRKWKYEKKAVVKWERRKRSWEFLQGTTTR